MEGYKEIKLETNYSLYYTNRNISNKIIIDLKANPASNMKLNLNLKQTNNLCNYLEKYLDELENKCKKYIYIGLNSFNKIIDNWNYKLFINDSFTTNRTIGDDLLLIGITYFGFDPSYKEEIKNMQKLEKNLKLFKIFFIFRIIYLAIFIILSFLFIIFYKVYETFKFVFFRILLLIICLTIINIIQNIISIRIFIDDIQNFIVIIINKLLNEEIEELDSTNKYITFDIQILFNLFFISVLIELIYYIIYISFYGKDPIFKINNQERNINNNNIQNHNNGINNNRQNERINNISVNILNINNNDINSGRINLYNRNNNNNNSLRQNLNN